MFDLFWAQNLINRAYFNFNTKSNQVFNFGSWFAISNIIFMTNKLGLLWLPNFISLGIYYIFGTKFSWNEEIGTCFNIKYVLLGRNFNFLVITTRYLGVTAGYCSLPRGYWWLLLAATFSTNVAENVFVGLIWFLSLDSRHSLYSEKKINK